MVLLGSLLNLGAVAEEARGRGEDVAVVCAGFKGAFALDDAYCAGRIVALLGGERSDAAIAAELVAGSFPDAHTALLARTYGPPGLEEDILFCSRESVLPVVPRLARHGRRGGGDRRMTPPVRVRPAAGRRRPRHGGDEPAAGDARGAAHAGARGERGRRGAGRGRRPLR